MSEQKEKISIIGAGAWGTALACAAARAGHAVKVWAREDAVVQSINAQAENALFLPGIALPSSIRATGDLAQCAVASVILLVTPAQHLRGTLRNLRPHLTAPTPLIICAKGIEIQTGALLDDVACAEVPHQPLAALSGPSFAAEVAQGLPAALTLASTDEALAKSLCQLLASPTFRLYSSTDTRGVLLGGALKNIIAIAAGVTHGKGLGDNARAAIITRGLAELMRLAVALGARPETLMGLSGLGDLALTCLGDQSRNLALGRALGQGATAEHALAGKSSVAEGATTARAALLLAEKHGMDVPIIRAVDALLRGAELDATIDALLARPLKRE